MTRSEFSNSDAKWLRSVEEMVVDTVLWFRNRGFRNQIAIEQTALALGLSPRKTRSLLYQEPTATLRDEYISVREAFRRHLLARVDDLARLSEAARMRHRQMELDLE